MKLRKLCVGASALALFIAPASAQIGPPAVSGASVASVSTTCPATGPSSGAVTLTTGVVPAAISGSTDTITAPDCGKLKVYSNATSTAVALSSASSLGANFAVTVSAASGAGAVTITSAGGTFSLNGTTTLTLAAGQSASISSDGTNWQTTGLAGGGTVSANPSFNSANILNAATPSSTLDRIYDDDFGGDVNASLTLLYGLIDQGVIKTPLAIVTDKNNTSNQDWEYIDAFNKYYGRSIPFGRYTGANNGSSSAIFTNALAQWPHTTTPPASCVTVIEAALTSAAANSVDYISTGGLSCISAVMQDVGGGGAALLKAKIHTLQIMGSVLPAGGSEANMTQDTVDSNYVFNPSSGTSWTSGNGYPPVYWSSTTQSIYNVALPAQWNIGTSPAVTSQGVTPSTRWDLQPIYLSAFGTSAPNTVVPNCTLGSTKTVAAAGAYTLLAADCGRPLLFTNAAAVTIALPANTSAGFSSGFWVPQINYTGAATLVATLSGKVNAGSNNFTLTQAVPEVDGLYSDGNSWQTGWFISINGQNQVDAAGANTWWCPTATVCPGGTAAAQGHFYAAVQNNALKFITTNQMDGYYASGFLSHQAINPQGSNAAGVLTTNSMQQGSQGTFNGSRLQNASIFGLTALNTITSGGQPPSASGCAGTLTALAGGGADAFGFTLGAGSGNCNATPATMTLNWPNGENALHRRVCWMVDETTPAATITPQVPGANAVFQNPFTVTNAVASDVITGHCMAF